MQVYYHNSISGDSSWTKPDGFVGDEGEKLGQQHHIRLHLLLYVPCYLVVAFEGWQFCSLKTSTAASTGL